MDRKSLESFIFDSYGIRPDYPFEGDGETAVFRHPSNGKWFAIVMRIPRRRLGLSGDASIDVVNLKADPTLIGALVSSGEGFFPAYHMNKVHWISAALDGSADDDTLRSLVELSCVTTLMKRRGKRDRG